MGTYNRVLEIEPNNKVALSNIALLTYRMGNKDEAFGMLSKLAEDTAKDNYLVHKYLGIILLEKGKTDDAIEKFMKTVDLNPNDADGYVNLGVCFHKLKNYGRAVQEYIKAIEIDPVNLSALKNLALLYYDADQIEDSIEMYERILELEPDNKTILKSLGNAYRRVGESQKAIDKYQEHLAAKPDDLDALLNIGVSLYEKGQLVKAIEIFNDIMIRDKNYSAACYLYLSKTYHKNGQFQKAFDTAKKSVHANPHSVEGFIQYGKAAMDIKNYSKAIGCFRSVLEDLDPDNSYADTLMKTSMKKYEELHGRSYEDIGDVWM